ncbi:MAG: hypothetical protein H2174_01780 [Vampirovibrio sp.]|nr:hypothetical protein [Vampirovibrio sp.]
MQSLSHVTFAGFQPAVLGTKHQATGVQQPSAVGQLAQTQTTDVLGAMPHYRPLPIGVRSGTGDIEKLLAHLHQEINEKTIEGLLADLEKAERLKDVTASMKKIDTVVENLLDRALASTPDVFMLNRLEAIAKLVDELKQNQANREATTASIQKLNTVVTVFLSHIEACNERYYASYDTLTVNALTMLKELAAELAGILKK